MARGKKKISGEVLPPDFDGAYSIYTSDVQPANKAQKQAMKDAGDAWKEIKNEHHVHKGGFHQAMKVAEMEEADQQAWLRSFYAGLKKRGVGLHADLADQMNDGTETDDDGFVAAPVVKPSTLETPLLN